MPIRRIRLIRTRNHIKEILVHSVIYTFLSIFYLNELILVSYWVLLNVVVLLLSILTQTEKESIRKLIWSFYCSLFAVVFYFVYLVCIDRLISPLPRDNMCRLVIVFCSILKIFTIELLCSYHKFLQKKEFLRGILLI